jgi:hypothetical protein
VNIVAASHVEPSDTPQVLAPPIGSPLGGALFSGDSGAMEPKARPQRLSPFSVIDDLSALRLAFVVEEQVGNFLKVTQQGVIVVTADILGFRCGFGGFKLSSSGGLSNQTTFSGRISCPSGTSLRLSLFTGAFRCFCLSSTVSPRFAGHFTPREMKSSFPDGAPKVAMTKIGVDN